MLGLVPLFAVRRLRPLAVATTGVLGASALLVFLLKGAVGRARPFVTLPDVHPLVAAPSDPSFPSGHACGSFTFAAFALLLLFRVRAPSVSTPVRAAWGLVLPALAVGVAWSRVYLGVHYPLDVAAGSLLGVCSGAVGASWYLRRAAAGPR
jgi:undecaprenyl-diphosphatase